MQRRTGSAAAVGVAISVVGACVADPVEQPALPATSQAAGALGGACPDWGCGANSPKIDSVGFHDLSLVAARGVLDRTIENDAGYAIEAAGGLAQIVLAGTSYDLSVVDGRFVATSCASTPCTEITGAALVGAAIALRRGEDRYLLTIDSVRPMTYFVDGGAVEGYTLLWQRFGDPMATNLCSNIKELEEQIAAQPGGGDSAYAAEELMGLRTWEAVVFEGDRIDAVAKTMSVRADDRWFNIGCAGHTLSKLRLTRNTIHGQPRKLPGAWEQRQATLKMLVADYCGTGVALTVAGQRLLWRGDAMLDYHAPPRELEARWTERGAVCLDAPRMLFPTSPLGASTFPASSLWTAIQDACDLLKLPIPARCPDPRFDNFAGAARISASP